MDTRKFILPVILFLHRQELVSKLNFLFRKLLKMIKGVLIVAQWVKNATQYPWGWGYLGAALKRQKTKTKIERRVNVYTSEIIPKNCRGRNTPKLILWGHHHLDNKTRQRYHKKRILQVNITDDTQMQKPSIKY